MDELGLMNESILVCVYYGPNGKRLIKRGHRLANIINCPVYVLSVDHEPYDEFDEKKARYIDEWRELCQELKVEEFILLDNEKRPAPKAIADIARQYNITQIVIGQTPQNRWEEITKGSFSSALLREISSFVDIHIVAVDRSIVKEDDTQYEPGVQAFLREEEDHYKLSFTKSKKNVYEGIFFKEVGTDFNNGIFKYVKNGKTYQVKVAEDIVTEEMK